MSDLPQPSPDYIPTTMHYLGIVKNQHKRLYMIEHAGMEIRVALDVNLRPGALQSALKFAAERLLEQVRLRDVELEEMDS